MEPAEQVRAVRRRLGLSQRQLAQRSEVSARTIAAIEGGERAPTVAVLSAVLAVAGLELSIDTVPPELGDEDRRHLRRSLTERLHRALGGGGVPRRSRAAGPGWDQLLHLAGCGRVVLHGELAETMWLPPQALVTDAEVCFAAHGFLPPGPVPDLRIRDACPGHAEAVVGVSIEHRMVGVDPPADLALAPEHGSERARLRGVARLLHQEAARDAAGRRVRAHADPRHDLEHGRVFHTKRFGRLPMPDETNRRGWRLHDDASLDAWLRRYGYPV